MTTRFNISCARARSRLWVAAGALLFAQPAFADCALRAATPKERDYSARLQASLLAALPAAPEHMALTAAPRAHVNSLCQETPEGEVRAAVVAIYRYALPPAEAERVARERAQLEAQIKSLKTLPPALKQEFDALEAKRQEAFRDARRAEKAGDKALASQKYREAGAFEEQGRAVRNRHLDAVKPQLDELEARRLGLPPETGDLHVRLEANGWGTAARSDETDLRLGALPPLKGGFKVHGLQAIVAGPRGADAQRNALLAAFDRARLQALIDQPLPQEPPPAAWRVGSAPVAAAPAASAPTPTPAAAPQPAGAPPASTPAAPDAAQTVADKAKEAAGKLRSLFGR